jgi:hypothetical protein
MVTSVIDKVTIKDVHPHVDQESRQASVQQTKTDVQQTDDSGNPVIVSKDFILNLLSLAIGKPFFLEGNLGNKVDVKI